MLKDSLSLTILKQEKDLEPKIEEFKKSKNADQARVKTVLED